MSWILSYKKAKGSFNSFCTQPCTMNRVIKPFGNDDIENDDEAPFTDFTWASRTLSWSWKWPAGSERALSHSCLCPLFILDYSLQWKAFQELFFSSRRLQQWHPEG